MLILLWEKLRGLACALNPPAQVKQEAAQPVSGCAEPGCGTPTELGSACGFQHRLCLQADLLCVDRKVGPHTDSTSSGVGGCGVCFTSALEVWSRETDCSHTAKFVDKLKYKHWCIISKATPHRSSLSLCLCCFSFIYTLLLLLILFTLPLTLWSFDSNKIETKEPHRVEKPKKQALHCRNLEPESK